MSKVDSTLMNQLLTSSDKLKIVLTKESVLNKKEVAQLVKDFEQKYELKVVRALNTSMPSIYLLEITDNKKVYIDSTGTYMICGFILNMKSDCILDNMLEQIKGAGNE